MVSSTDISKDEWGMSTSSQVQGGSQNIPEISAATLISL